MKRIKNTHFLYLLLLLFSCEKNNCPLQAYTYSMKMNSSNGIDVLLVYNATTQGNSTYTSHPTLYAEAWTNGGTQLCRSIIDFPLTDIPSGATISKATLLLYADTTNPVFPKHGHSDLSGDNDWVIKKITDPWTMNNVTWNNQPATDNTDTIALPKSTSGEQMYTVDMTGFIKERYEHPTSHYGYLIKLNNETYYRSIAFCSSNHQYQTLTPELKIEYIR